MEMITPFIFAAVIMFMGWIPVGIIMGLTFMLTYSLRATAISFLMMFGGLVLVGTQIH